MSSDIAVIDAAPTTTMNLFGASSPEAVLIIAQEMAKPLADVIREHEMFTMIKGKEHVHIEGWQTLGSMLGVSAHTVWSRRLDDQDSGWEARAEARTRYGEVVGSAEAMCTRDERGGNWKRGDSFALRSMAQTRAQSKALASALRFVMTLAGASGTPVEEVPEASAEAVPQWARPVPDLHELVKSCADVLGGTLNMELATERAKTLCHRLYNECGQDVPMVVWETFSLLLGAMIDREPDEVREAEEVPASTSIEPEPADPTAVEPDAEVPHPGAHEYSHAGDHLVDPDTTTEEDQS